VGFRRVAGLSCKAMWLQDFYMPKVCMVPPPPFQPLKDKEVRVLLQ
jgi:hypothetical protein